MSIIIKVIGAPSIEIDGKKLQLPLKKAEAIVYYLAIEGDASREKLASIFWAAKDENAAQNNFRNAFYLLKQYFHSEHIKSDRRHVMMTNVRCDLDIINKICDIDNSLPQSLSDELLKDFDITDCADFSNWLLIARSRYKKCVTEKLLGHD